jgi:hypothetical protein
MFHCVRYWLILLTFEEYCLLGYKALQSVESQPMYGKYKEWATKTSPCTATFEDLLCLKSTYVSVEHIAFIFRVEE